MAPKKKGRRSSVSSKASSSGNKGRDEASLKAAMDAMKEKKENTANLRKNRAFQELKREMDQKKRNRDKVSIFGFLQ